MANEYEMINRVNAFEDEFETSMLYNEGYGLMVHSNEKCIALLEVDAYGIDNVVPEIA